jgi:acyl-ACP thioesterase
MIRTIWTQTYDVNTILLTHRKRLGLVGLLNILQDVAWIHARHLGHGFDEILASGAIWVLARQALAVERWPAWGESVTVRTWVRPPDGPLAHRDYEIMSSGQPVGTGTASWLLLDVRTRRPRKLTLEAGGAGWRRDGALLRTPQKIVPLDGLAAIARFGVRVSDLDLNGHVNNSRYAQWISDSVPLEGHLGFDLVDYEVNFLGETRVGDEVWIEQGVLDPMPRCPLRHHYQGRRVGDGKVVFAARLGASETKGYRL